MWGDRLECKSSGVKSLIILAIDLISPCSHITFARSWTTFLPLLGGVTTTPDNRGEPLSDSKQSGTWPNNTEARVCSSVRTQRGFSNVLFPANMLFSRTRKVPLSLGSGESVEKEFCHRCKGSVLQDANAFSMLYFVRGGLGEKNASKKIREKCSQNSKSVEISSQVWKWNAKCTLEWHGSRLSSFLDSADAEMTLQPGVEGVCMFSNRS